MKVFKVILKGFDNMENHNPNYTESYGIFSTKKKAEIKVKQLIKDNPKYKGYNNKLYPIILVKEVEVE